MDSCTFQRRQVFYSGNVQGVGFRYTTHRIAQDFDVTGFVRNLPDRRVEVVAEGPKQQLDHFFAAIAEQMSDQIRSVQCDTRPSIHEFHRFDIRY
ncbi:MAG: acylphosphatase [Planctomycetes bacterium]|nr:acylphosphatase [Planctomycetota bacterium]